MSPEVIQTKVEQVEKPRAYSMDEAIEEGGLKNDRIVAHWKPRWEFNFCAGFQHIRPDTMNLRSLSMRHDGQTAVIVSTGPSLDRNIKEMLAADRERFSVLSSTSALNPLVANGITPDYALINDGAPWVAELHYKDLEKELESVPLILATTCHPSTASKWPGPRYYHHDHCPDDSLLGRDGLLFRVLPQLTGIPVGGCTSNLAVRVAVLLGFTRILLVGSDLAFPDRKSHCTKYNREGSGWTPKEIDDAFYRKKARWLFHGCPAGCSYVVHEWEPSRAIEAELEELEKCSQCGKEMRHVPTSAEYLFYLRDLIPLANAQPKVEIDDKEIVRKVKVVNATGDGVGVMLDNQPFAEALEAVVGEQPAADGG